MNTKELRLGNLIYRDSEIYEVDLLSISHPNIINLYPIPLTAEILEKAGFENYNPEEDEWDCFYKDDFPYLIQQIPHTSDYRISLYDGLSKYINIKYVHQLQNAYYILSGEELEVTI